MTTVEPYYNPEYSLAPLLTSSRSGQSDSSILDGAQWLTQCYADALPRFEILDAYYRGHPPMVQVPERVTDKYRALQEMSLSNWCGLIVDVVDERLRIKAFKSSAHPDNDPALWDAWEYNNMALHSSEVHVEALKMGVSYVSAWPAEPFPKIQGESPLSTYVLVDDYTRQPVEAIRIWCNRRTGRVYADYTTPDWQFHLVSTGKAVDEVHLWRSYRWSGLDVRNVQWEFRTDVPAASMNTLGQVPYVVFVPRPDLLGGYHSEIEGLLPIQDRIIRTTFDRLVTQEMTAFPQRWVTGIDIPLGKDGKPREPFDAAQDRVWTMSSPDSHFGQFPQSSPDGYLAAITADIQAMATQSRTPPHLLVGGMGQFPSGESVRATEYGLSRKVASRQLALTDPWGDVGRLVGDLMGDPELATDAKVAPRWAEVEAHSEAEVADAIMKLSTIPGMPIGPLLERAGIDPALYHGPAQVAPKPAPAPAPPPPDPTAAP